MGDNKHIVRGEKIRVGISDPELAGRVKVRLNDLSGPVLWFIKFNIILDPVTVSHKSMTVTETNGYILDTEITYDTAKNMIVMKPTDPYEEGIYYILTITRKVRSKGGNNLKRDIHIVFKIKDRRIEEYRILPPETVVEKPRKKPEKLKRETAARAFSPEVKEKIDKTPAASLPYGKFGVNVLILVLGIPAALSGLLLDSQYVVLGGAALVLAGIAHLCIQLVNRKKRAAMVYNIGVMHFNAGFYKAAAKRFAKAHELDEQNELAEYAAGKVKFYT